MSEILKPTPHALVTRFTFEDDTLKHAINAEQYFLTPGNGIVFYGEGDKTSIAATFEQSDITYVLQNLEPGSLQLLSILDTTTGGLLFTQGTPETSIGLNRQMPKGQRQMGVTYGRLQFAGIWGESKQEVRETLQRLQAERVRLN